MVDPATLIWSGPPKDLKANAIKPQNFYSFALDDVFFNDGRVLTGIQFYVLGTFIRTMIFGASVRKNEAVDDVLWSPDCHHLTNELKTHMAEYNRGPLDLHRSDSNENLAIELSLSNDTVFVGKDIVQDYPLVLSGVGFVHYENENGSSFFQPILKTIGIKNLY
jgi:hypothetical protein